MRLFEPPLSRCGIGVRLVTEQDCTVSQAYSHFEPIQAVFDLSLSLGRTNTGILFGPGTPLNESEKDVFFTSRTILFRY